MAKRVTKFYTVEDIAMFGREITIPNGHTIKFNEFTTEVSQEDVGYFQRLDDYIIRSSREVVQQYQGKEEYVPKIITSNIICYTCITNEYDDLKDQKFTNNARFIAYVSDRDIYSDSWEVEQARSIYGNPRKDARYHKIMPHLLFDCEYSIWLDGSIKLISDPQMLIDRYLKNSDIATFKHPDRICLYEEARVCIANHLDDPAIINNQVNRYRQEGYPVNHGLAETKVVIRRHTDEVKRFNEAWFKQLDKNSIRDQISFPYVAWKLKTPIAYMPSLTHPAYTNGEFSYSKHLPEESKQAIRKSVEHKRSKVEVIIVKFNNWEVEEPCIESVLENTSGNYYLNIYDNYPKNENIGELWNKLIKESEAQYICLLNSDTVVTPHWLDKLTEVFLNEKDAGVVGPTTDHSHNHQSKAEPSSRYDVVDFSKFVLGNGFPEVLSGFCLVFPKKVWEEAGGFPENFGFYGQEVRLIDKILKKGYKQYWRKDVFIHHEGSATAKKFTKLGTFNEQEERSLAEKQGRER